MTEEIEIKLPPVKLSKDDRGWRWLAPNGASGSHEQSARAAAISAVAGMGIPLTAVELPAIENPK